MPLPSPTDISKLPTIVEALQILERMQHNFVARGGWLQVMPQLQMFQQIGLDNPFCSLFNNAAPDAFIVNRLASGRYCCKPNIAQTPFLFRGEKKKHPCVVSAFNRPDNDKDDKLINNLKTADFVSLVKTHPLCRMFDNGVNLPSFSRTLFFETNYYGLAQHYNFNTGLIDFSGSALVAAFFAVTENLGGDLYQPITDAGKYGYGVIYLHGIVPQASFQLFSTIGQQVFPRCGAQRAFAFQENNTSFNINTHLQAYYFRHDAECSQKIFDLLDGGKALFPADELGEHAKAIKEKKEVSFVSFANNLYSNPQDTLNGNLERCSAKGITVNPNLNYCFTSDMLSSFFADVKNGIWEQYCASIHFPCSDGNRLKEELLALPKNANYRQYFDIRYYDKLFYHTLEDKFRAEQKYHRQKMKA